MSKILLALAMFAIVYSVQGCTDSCSGCKPGRKYPSKCGGPCNRYYWCNNKGKVNYGSCGQFSCLQGSICGSCPQDSCRGKRNGDYESSDLPRPMYYHCQGGHMSIRTCHPNEVFNAWTHTCQCYEVFCEMGDGLQPSMCGGGGCSGYVRCQDGYAMAPRDPCPRSKPHFCCETHVCKPRPNPNCASKCNSGW